MHTSTAPTCVLAHVDALCMMRKAFMPENKLKGTCDLERLKVPFREP